MSTLNSALFRTGIIGLAGITMGPLGAGLMGLAIDGKNVYDDFMDKNITDALVGIAFMPLNFAGLPNSMSK